jgi:hypothetical protein
MLELTEWSWFASCYIYFFAAVILRVSSSALFWRTFSLVYSRVLSSVWEDLLLMGSLVMAPDRSMNSPVLVMTR